MEHRIPIPLMMEGTYSMILWKNECHIIYGKQVSSGICTMEHMIPLIMEGTFSVIYVEKWVPHNLRKTSF